MNYELLLELLKQPSGFRGIDTPAEAAVRQGGLNALRGQAVPNVTQLASRGSRSIDTPVEAVARMAGLGGSRSIDTPAEQYMRIGAMGNQNATQSILKAILGQ